MIRALGSMIRALGSMIRIGSGVGVWLGRRCWPLVLALFLNVAELVLAVGLRSAIDHWPWVLA